MKAIVFGLLTGTAVTGVLVALFLSGFGLIEQIVDRDPIHHF